jgi:lysophospholipase L1-like esterase
MDRRALATLWPYGENVMVCKTLAAALVVGLLVPLPAGAAEAAPAAAAPAKIMVIGDSITHGSAGDYTWRYRLWQHLSGNGVAVDFVGPSTGVTDQSKSSGNTVVETDAYAVPGFDRDHDARWGRFLGTWRGYYTGAGDTIKADVQTYQPAYVVALLGVNDLFWFSTLAPSVVADKMAAFVDNARAGRSSVRLVLMGLPSTRSAQHDATLAGRVADYNQRLSALAAARSTTASPVVYVPPPAGYQADYDVSPHDSYDGTHPNARGEIRIADAVADVLSARFGLGPAYPLSLTGVATGPVLPFALRCVPGDGTVTLTWDESPGATGYWYQRRVAGGAWDAQVYQLKMSDSPLPNVWLTNGVTYEYRLQAAKLYDKGVFSNVCSATPAA